MAIQSAEKECAARVTDGLSGWKTRCTSLPNALGNVAQRVEQTIDDYIGFCMKRKLLWPSFLPCNKAPKPCRGGAGWYQIDEQHVASKDRYPRHHLEQTTLTVSERRGYGSLPYPLLLLASTLFLSKPCRRSRAHSQSCGCRASSCCRGRGRGTCGGRTQRASQQTPCGWQRSWPDGCRSRC